MTIICPDCGRDFGTREGFVAHRAKDHPPSPTTLTVPGIASREAHGYQPEGVATDG